MDSSEKSEDDPILCPESSTTYGTIEPSANQPESGRGEVESHSSGGLLSYIRSFEVCSALLLS